ncbi:MAG: glycosyltransferase family 39 protein [Candidatus Pacebacteria bacterium]|nr:glycosyltransferase family 39 protein [Candidatus Paceibacterota bacterium]
MIKENKHRAFLFIFFFFIYSFLSFLLFYYNNFYSFPNADINQQFAFSENLAQTGKFGIVNNLNQNYDPIFGPRLAMIKDGVLYPTAFLGIIIIWALIRKISPFFIFLIGPLFSLLAAIYFYKIMKLFIKENKYLNLGIILFFITPPISLYSILPYNNIISTAIFIVNLFYLLKISRKIDYKNMVFCGFLLGVQVWMRSVDVLFYIPIILYIFYKQKNKIRNHFKEIFISIFIFLIILAPLLYLNKKFYNNYLGPIGAYNQDRLSYSQLHDPSNEYLYPKINRFSRLSNTIYNKLFSFSTIFMVFAVIGMILFIRKKDKEVGWVFISTILIQLFYYGSQQWSGIDIPNSVFGSFDRYMMISWTLLVFFVVFFWHSFSFKFKKISLFFFSILVLTSFINITFFNQGGYFSYWLKVSKQTHEDKKIFSKDNSVLFTGLYDKYLYNENTIPAIHVSFPMEERLGKTTKLMANLKEDGYTVYYIHDTVPELDYSKDEYFEEMKKNALVPINEWELNRGGTLYEIGFTK